MHFKIFKNFIIKKHNSNLENQLYQIKDKFCFDSIYIFHEYKISNSQCSLHNNKHTHIDVRIVIKSEADILLY